MSRPKVESCDIVPRTRPQRSLPAPTVETLMDTPRPATPYYGRTLPDEGIGRIPTIGIDTGHIPGTRPDQSRILK